MVEFEGKYREGRKRVNWWLEGINEYWKHITTPLKTEYSSKTRFSAYQYETLNLKSSKHLEILDLAAQIRIGLKKENDNVLSEKTQMSLGWVKNRNSKADSQREKPKYRKCMNREN